MKQVYVVVSAMLLSFCSLSIQAQQTVATDTNVIVPPLVNFSGTLTDTNGRPGTSNVAVTFSLYSEPTGGAALWMETQNVEPDSRGQYTVMLGSTSSSGLPAGIFVAGEAHWLGVQAQGQEEQPRVLLVSAPYALKAGDAQTLGGLPASAFVLAAAPSGAATGTAAAASTSAAATASISSDATSDVTTTGGTVNALPLFSTATNIQNSLITQTGTTAINVGGKLNLPDTGTATASAGKDSRPQDFVASAFNSGTSTAVAQTFQLQAEPAGNDTATTSGTFNLLYGSGTATPAETGFKISNKGLITFATGQTFPGTGDGTVTGVTAGTDLTGGGTGGKVTLNLNTAALNSAYAQLGVANTFTGNQTVNGNLSATGTVSGGSFQIGSNLFAFGSYTTGNAFLGFSGNSSTTANGLTASGYQALLNNTSGGDNTGTGSLALQDNTTGCCNTASGALALQFNTTGSNNSASGISALQSNTTGSYNTATGSGALNSSSTASYNTATGYQALFNTTANENTATGYQALQSSTTGGQNTATGYQALQLDTTGLGNIADGIYALAFNTTGSSNTGVGAVALGHNTTGSYNTAIGGGAGIPLDTSNVTGSTNTFVGSQAAQSTGTLNNATAIGAFAEVGASNSLVLGSFAGSPLCEGGDVCPNTNVGIGTIAPNAALDVVGNNIQILLGDPGCGSGLAGIGFVVEGGFNGCNNFAIVGKNTGDLYINSVESGTIHFRNNNASDLMVIDTSGDVSIKGNLSKGGGSFKIDHPLDPANKYLYHSFVESPDMMNVYNGNVVTNRHGVATVTLPDYFEALNRDFRYQLTVIGQFAQAIVAKKIANNRFVIRTNKPSVEVSWQVTGIRHDVYADAHRIQVEVEKPPQEQGHYLYPELFGAAADGAARAQAAAVTESEPHANR
jgi:trimeric autotransporter adhesin